MLPAILGLGGLTAKIIATAVIPRVVRAISQSFSVTRPPEPCSPPAVEGISSAPEPASVAVLSGVSAPLRKSRKWGYAGLWHHGPSGLDLATYRLYDAANKRWISRDPLGEGVDYNLYRYCGNDPIGCVDPEGLQPAIPIPLLVEAGAAIIEGIEALSAMSARALPHTANAAAAANSSSYSFPDEYGGDRFERMRETYDRMNPDDQAVQMAKDRSRGRGGNKGKTTGECKLKGAEHTKNARKSTEGRHEKGRARAGDDQLRKEKGDKRRPY